MKVNRYFRAETAKHLSWILAGVLAATWSPAAELPDLKLSGNRVETGKHLITVGPSGLPEQIVIKAEDSELPFEERGGRAETSTLLAIGRGRVLRDGGMVLAAVAGGQAARAEVTKKAELSVKGGYAVCASRIKTGPIEAQLGVAYGKDGSIRCKLVYEGGETEALELVIPIEGPVDTVIPGRPVADKVKACSASDYTIGAEEGLAWGNSDEDAKAVGNAPCPGVLEHMYAGSGDRGFTWLSEKGKGWTVDESKSTMVLQRDENRQIAWHIRFVNKPEKVSKKTVEFAILIHPASAKPEGRRKKTWLEWPFGDAKPETITPSLKTWHQADKCRVLRADAGTVLEAFSDYAVLEGPAGGDAVSVEKNHTDTYPVALMRYLAGTHTGNAVRLRSNSAELIRPGANPSTDRVVMGRALLFDIGLDAGRLAHLADAAEVVSALDRFGYFADDGQTEFIPFWRTGRIVRFGQEWRAGSGFELTKENPLAEVYVSVYRRPGGAGGEYQKAMIVIVNESNHYVRDSLYILDPPRVFGGENVQDAGSIVSKISFAHIPERSDWNKTSARWLSGGASGDPLEDIEDHGMIGRFSSEGGTESYGPTVFVRAHDFVILSGTGGEVQKKRGRR
ncbi:MAG: hypothetical protein R6V03_11345 [Kiritimatiellia bacterium]